MSSLTDYAWDLNDGTICGDPREIAEQFANLAETFGLRAAVGPVVIGYLVPLLFFGSICCLYQFVKYRVFVLRWPDLLLLTLPMTIWLMLVLTYPVGKPLPSFWEVVALGCIAAVSIGSRRQFAGPLRTEAAKVGLVGTMSLAVCFWALSPDRRLLGQLWTAA